MEMVVYFTARGADWQIPENILTQVKRFSKFEVEAHEENKTLIIKVPKREKEICEKLRDDIYNMLVEIQSENSVLASKLARYYGFYITEIDFTADVK